MQEKWQGTRQQSMKESSMELCKKVCKKGSNELGKYVCRKSNN